MSVSIVRENCEYQGEGNAAIVIRLIKEGNVLRIKKHDAFEVDPSANEDFKELENQTKFLENVLCPILGDYFINKPTIVFLKKKEVQILNEVVSQLRPVHRRHKNIIEKDTYACLLPDFCMLSQNLKLLPTYGPDLCIELKPKQGFTKKEYVTTSNLIQPPMCRFCMMQKYKLKKCTVSSKSEYCPMDLYSGCQERMMYALKMLLKTPQNNLRIFKNQKLVYSEEKKENLHEILLDFVPDSISNSTDLLCDLIVQALIKPFPSGMDKIPVSIQKNYSQNCINAYSPCSENDLCQLPSYCVLERILSGQLLDDLPMVDLFHLYLQVKESKVKCSDFIGCYSRSEIPPFVGEVNIASNESQYKYASRKVWEFLVALVIKDCSVMLTLKHLYSNSETHNHNILKDKCGNLYAFFIAIADLDAKSFNKIEKVYNDLSCMLEL